MSYKGRYTPRYLSKYRGDSANITYRSLWERRFMEYLDTNPSVLSWASEEIAIPYFSPVDRKHHRYFADFWMQYKSKDGTIKISLVEIKPYKQTIPPASQRLNKQRLLQESMTYSTNLAKWTAAREFCSAQGWEFVIITEKDLPSITPNTITKSNKTVSK